MILCPQHIQGKNTQMVRKNVPEKDQLTHSASVRLKRTKMDKNEVVKLDKNEVLRVSLVRSSQRCG